jgi:hypothetical protein
MWRFVVLIISCPTLKFADTHSALNPIHILLVPPPQSISSPYPQTERNCNLQTSKTAEPLGLLCRFVIYEFCSLRFRRGSAAAPRRSDILTDRVRRKCLLFFETFFLVYCDFLTLDSDAILTSVSYEPMNPRQEFYTLLGAR